VRDVAVMSRLSGVFTWGGWSHPPAFAETTVPPVETAWDDLI